jgi:rare lipoprotein A
LLCFIAAVSLLSACTSPTSKGPGGYKVGKPYRVAGQWYYPRVDYAYHEKGLASWYGPNFHGKPTANGETFDMRKVSAAHKTLPLPSIVRVTNLENGRSLVVRVNDRGPFIRGRIIDLSQKAAELLGFVEQGTTLVEVQLIVESSRQAALALGAAGHPDFGPAPPKAAPSIEVTVENLDPEGNPAVAGQAKDATRGQPVRVASAASRPSETPPPYDGMTNINTGANMPGAATAGDRTSPEPGESVDLVPVGETPPIFIQAGAFSQFDNANRLRARLGVLGYPVRVHQVYITNQPMFRVRIGPLRSVESADQTLDRLVAAGYPDAQIVID